MLSTTKIKIKLFIFYIFFNFISTAKAQKNTTSIIANFFSDIIRFPQIVVINDEIDFVCPSTKDYSNLKEYTSLFSQVGTFTPIAGLLFSIFIYGAKSVFGIMTTCLIDDMVIIAASFGPILWWYTFAKPLWLFGIIHEIQKDTNYNYEFIYSIVLGILLGSMVVILILGSILRLHFHNRRNKLNEDSLWFHMSPKNYRLTNKEFFAVSTAFFVWGQFDEFNSDNGSKLRHIIFLIWKDLSLVKVDVLVAFTVFNTILTIVLTRSIASFFSDGGVIECTYKHGGDEKVYAEIKVKNINEVVYFYYQKDKELDKWTRCRFGSTSGHFYICEEDDDDEGKNDQEKKNLKNKLNYEYDEKEQLKKLKDKKFKKFFLKVKKYLFGKGVFESGPILKEIKKITGADATCPLKHHNLKVKKMGVENKVRINILETGALNYFIYSHRKNSEEEDEQKEQKEQKEKYVFEISEFHKKC
ncbi:18378_t:CDS:2 [Entrophospora sp. SA101]|nr:18378_t:CDS:2 [Entrophospora sp. SA101]